MNEDLQNLSNYFKDWRLKANPGKTVHCVFHLTDQQANKTLKLKLDGVTVEYDKTPKYLGSFLERSLTHRHQLEYTKKKLRSRVSMIQKLTGTKWGCSAETQVGGQSNQ